MNFEIFGLGCIAPLSVIQHFIEGLKLLNIHVTSKIIAKDYILKKVCNLGVSLNRVSSTKSLGVIIDENLTWKNHIDAISKTISRNTGMLTKLKHFVPENILYSLYCTLILPYINYA